MSSTGEVGRDGLGDAVLEGERTALLDAPPGCVRRGLRVDAVIDHPGEHLHMTLRLHRAAHDAERQLDGSVPLGEPRDDRVERPLAPRHDVGMLGPRGEPGAAVLQRDAGVGDDDPRAEAVVVGLDEGHHPPLVVGGGQVDGAAAGRQSVTGLAGALGVEQRGAGRHVGGVE